MDQKNKDVYITELNVFKELVKCIEQELGDQIEQGVELDRDHPVVKIEDSAVYLRLSNGILLPLLRNNSDANILAVCYGDSTVEFSEEVSGKLILCAYDPSILA